MAAVRKVVALWYHLPTWKEAVAAFVQGVSDGEWGTGWGIEDGVILDDRGPDGIQVKATLIQHVDFSSIARVSVARGAPG